MRYLEFVGICISAIIIVIFIGIALGIIYFIYLNYRFTKTEKLKAFLKHTVYHNVDVLRLEGYTEEYIDGYVDRSNEIIDGVLDMQIAVSIKPIRVKYWYTKEQLKFIYHED